MPRTKPRTALRRVPKNAVHERAAMHAILDEATHCHLGVIDPAGFPVVVPTLHARVGDVVYVHGSAASRSMRVAGTTEICLTVTLLDGLVLARSAFHHSVNYRSVLVFGAARAIEDADEKLHALEAFTEKLVPGRWAHVRAPSAQELRATAVLALALDESSAKVRTGGPADDEPDYALPVWAGVVPLHVHAGTPEPDPRLTPGTRVPEHVARLATSLVYDSAPPA
jgi:nitroimidazol reductase NimA-like FMN-containing flavoprotein (pyridoxamine 5'-phosphate oxidase superfamily)